MFKKAFFFLIVTFLFGQNSTFVLAADFSELNSEQSLQEPQTATGEILVKLSDSVDEPDELNQLANENELETKSDFLEENIAVLKTKDAQEDVEQKIKQLSQDPRIEYAQPNFKYHSFAISTNDPDRDLQWALDNFGQTIDGVTGTVDADISAKEAWIISEGNENPVIVAVIDDGVNYSHGDLTLNMWDGSSCVGDDGLAWGGCNHGYDFYANDKDPLAENGDAHGTLIAGVVAGAKNNGIGSMGVAPNAKLMALRIGGGNTFTTDNAVRAIAFAKNNGAKIINASWGGNEYDLLLKNAIESFGGLFVTAAGNSGVNNDSSHVYPCDFTSPNIVCVAATDQNDTLWTSSDFSSTSVDLGAPGVNIFGPGNAGADSYVLGEGTSLAAPHVVGAAALLWSHLPTLSAAQVKTQILGSGDSLPTLAGKTVSGKRLNVYAALGGTGIALQNTTPFLNTDVGFSGKDVSKGKTTKEKVKLNFENVQNAVEFVISRRSDFSGANWETIKSGVNVSLKHKGKAETFYVKFRDANGIESAVFRNKVERKNTDRTIKNSKDTVKFGMILIQSGKGFSKKSDVTLFFGTAKSVVKTNSSGSFSVSYKINKPPGKYSWYALDLKTGKKSKTITYKVIK